MRGSFAAVRLLLVAAHVRAAAVAFRTVSLPICHLRHTTRTSRIPLPSLLLAVSSSFYLRFILTYHRRHARRSPPSTARRSSPGPGGSVYGGSPRRRPRGRQSCTYSRGPGPPGVGRRPRWGPGNPTPPSGERRGLLLDTLERRQGLGAR